MSDPKEVFCAIAADFRRRNLGYARAAQMLGYKRQTLSNLISSRKEYLSAPQAMRFVSAFGYSFDFLTKGVGDLCEEDSRQSGSSGCAPSSRDSGRLAVLMSMISRYIYLVDDSWLTSLYQNFLFMAEETDPVKVNGYLKNQERLLDMLARSKGLKLKEGTFSDPASDI